MSNYTPKHVFTYKIIVHLELIINKLATIIFIEYLYKPRNYRYEQERKLGKFFLVRL